MFTLRDADGRFVARARTRESAHRATRRAGAVSNRIVPTRARRFHASAHFSAIVHTGPGAEDTVLIAYRGPSLSVAREKARRAAQLRGMPASVVDDRWNPIATYGPDGDLNHRTATIAYDPDVAFAHEVLAAMDDMSRRSHRSAHGTDPSASAMQRAREDNWKIINAHEAEVRGANARRRSARKVASRLFERNATRGASRPYPGPQVLRLARGLDRAEAYRLAEKRATRDFRGFHYDARTGVAKLI